MRISLFRLISRNTVSKFRSSEINNGKILVDNRFEETRQMGKAQQIALKFQEAWQQGNRPDWVQFLNEAPEESRMEVFRQLTAIDIREREKLGEKPAINEYFDHFPSDEPTVSASIDDRTDTVDESVTSSSSANGITSVDVRIGEKLGKYEIQSVLGVGGMGVVFGAHDTVIRRDVAIKFLSSKHSTDETALSRLLQEAQTAGSIHHPNIVGIYDVLEVDGSYFVVMEKVNGENLAEILKKSECGFLDCKLATSILIDCCNALSAAHKRGMIHRDVKPQNIMLTADLSAKLLDFGLAKSEETANTTLTREGTILGTPDFMSPEQCRAAEVTALSDIYSLGATYFALLSGHPPYASSGSQLKVMFAHCNRPVPKLERIGIPVACQSIIQRAMAKSPEDRFESASEFKAALQSISKEDQEKNSRHDASQQSDDPFETRMASVRNNRSSLDIDVCLPVDVCPFFESKGIPRSHERHNFISERRPHLMDQTKSLAGTWSSG